MMEELELTMHELAKLVLTAPEGTIIDVTWEDEANDEGTEV